jgi:ABC-type molybdenum transport system ATPase subunit/photorepair protein PhrA
LHDPELVVLDEPANALDPKMPRLWATRAEAALARWEHLSGTERTTEALAIIRDHLRDDIAD